ncbi:MAG: hypothetical protein B7733_04295 [Myxococcales bacterium FL481]|nr:MAG: hypothetical protein B7733_04295 [Myxococcales bacterium FL481]
MASREPPLAPSVTEVDSPAPRPNNERGRVVRDLVVFQGKLFLDGLKDIVVSPLSIAAAIMGLLMPGNHARYLHGVFTLGRLFDRWLNLFPERGGPEGVDVYLDRLESAIAREVAQGRISARARDALRRALQGVESVPADPDRRTDR